MSKRYTTKQDIYGDWAVFSYDLLICGNIPDKAIAEIFCKELNKLVEENSSWLRTASRLDTVMHEDRTYIEKLLDENKQLKRQKERYKRLSEIRAEEINNRILTIKEFIDDCSDEEIKEALKDLFYSEVNEYDLSKKYRELHEENEDLKEKNEYLKQALERIVEAFDDHISDKSPVRDLIK